MFRSAKAPIAAWLACAAALVLLALFAYGLDLAQRADAHLLTRVMTPAGSTAGTVAGGIASLGDPLPLLIMLAVACGIALRRGRPLDAGAAIAVVAGANVTTQILKLLLAHPRYQPVLGAHQPASVAFPSGHATAAASIAIAFALVVPSRLLPTVALLGSGFACAVGCSVMALGWHLPSDVVGGVLVAAGWGFAVIALGRVVRREGGRLSPAVAPPSR